MRQIVLIFVLAFALPSFAQQADERSENQKTIEDLIESYSNVEYFWQQNEVAQELIELGDKKLIPKMQPFLKTDDRRRKCNAAYVIAGLGDERGLKILITELRDKKPRLTKLSRSDGRPDVEGQIREDRYYAALLLGKLGNKDAVPALIKATKDETINPRAAISLGEIGDKTAIPALRKMAQNFPGQRLWAGYGLAALGEQEGFQILTDVIESDARWTDRRHAVEALGKFHDSRALPVLIKALKDKHVNVRVSAARSLGAIGDTDALPALNEALTDTEVTKVNAPTTVEAEARKAIEEIKKSRKTTEGR